MIMKLEWLNWETWNAINDSNNRINNFEQMELGNIKYGNMNVNLNQIHKKTKVKCAIKTTNIIIIIIIIIIINDM